MWVAKPISKLNQAEELAWHDIEKAGIPLSQTLAWGAAIESAGGFSYLVFSPDEKVGGIVHTIPHTNFEKTRFDCVNGPYLNWRSSTELPRQLATFAMAVSKLNQKFESLTMMPRWNKSSENQKILESLPLSMQKLDSAATIVLKIAQKNADQILGSFQPRLQRTIRTSLKFKPDVRVLDLTHEQLDCFVNEMIRFGKKRGFTVPPFGWFKSLVFSKYAKRSIRFSLIQSRINLSDADFSESKILVATLGVRAYYLFGYENKNGNFPSKLSCSALSHWQAMTALAAESVEYYDFNGYITNPKAEDPYLGVNQFKSQFSGELLEYSIPIFEVSAN